MTFRPVPPALRQIVQTIEAARLVTLAKKG